MQLFIYNYKQRILKHTNQKSVIKQITLQPLKHKL